jgi:DNA-binding transcriptional regulator YdaS (Cro superfamily)
MDDKVLIPWDRVAVLLARAGRSQAWLAKQLNISSNVVSNWKSRGGVPAERGPGVARAFGVSVTALLSGDLEAPAMSRSAVRLVQRIGEMDRGGLLTRQAEAAVMAFLDLLEGVAVGTQTKGRT